MINITKKTPAHLPRIACVPISQVPVGQWFQIIKDGSSGFVSLSDFDMARNCFNFGIVMKQNNDSTVTFNFSKEGNMSCLNPLTYRHVERIFVALIELTDMDFSVNVQ